MAQALLRVARMNVSLYQAAAALNANSRWQEVIAENLASSSVPGYRMQDLTVEATQAGLMPAGGAGSSQTFTMPKAVTMTNFQPGSLKFTGGNKDVAIEGKGFFEVQLPNGSSAFTRDGEFSTNSQGQLITKQGYPVLGDTGPIQLDLHNPDPVSISSTGVVTQGADVKGKIKVMDVNDPHLLTQISGGYFMANDPKIIKQPAVATLRQGYIEGSNVSSLGQMANMMTAMRNFESNQKVIQIQDERLGKTISDLGSTQ